MYQEIDRLKYKHLEINNQKFLSEELIERVVNYGMIPQLVREIIIDQVTANIEITQDEGKLALQQALQQLNIDSNEKLEQWLRYHCMSMNQLELRAIRALKLTKFKQQKWESKVNFTFLERKQNLERVIYSLIRTKDFCTAQELYFRINEGEQPFDQLAREYSMGPEAETGGLVGPVKLASIDPTLGKILRSIDVGKIHIPTVIGDWIILVRLEKILPAKLDSAMKQRLIDENFNKWLEDSIHQKIKSISIS
ncbi:parvulin-like peptidyl-prolyl isomerase [Synechococcus sp. PCC 7502]|uniref:peptidylprolyl isomerase n=1 Tax=Synechococcus sp. PCC 7502 TaxID=1173263 RepID=UPI00029FDC1D|nr:peptidylprolyl isomerase [Synechococcus sp. PCC 7502]AFY73836.1 parvulin-like peptidyl-prolyl isomerase [Synechococcus sp. PCC 7502]